ncbi:type II toxin-antitoxin system RelE/ParE family toxin [Sphingomonas lenta]|uniref:Plasmid stabilization protein n=1 Tax=Sphingomonas lenta TaxID=1141887 RepID=A0A2A2SBL3_9SPHN|nr:type II toxin-antitoxin system RelE/ParE family toxin [Sphingomonas lenta]PAX06562.1 plasmid stabilization protein [Sphingomonas lenta]
MSRTDRYEVVLDAGAEDDLRSTAAYLAEVYHEDAAAEFVDAVFDRISVLERFPGRGSAPKELEGINRKGYLQVLLGRYRIFYRIIGERVVVVLIADGRRDMGRLLASRLLAPDPPA